MMIFQSSRELYTICIRKILAVIVSIHTKDFGILIILRMQSINREKIFVKRKKYMVKF